jgi:thiosulfate/3-mercaptopyruvate sulfurtransferase
LSDWGIDSDVQLIVYDDAGGAMAAARLWWILNWLGHETIAVLDGGWQAWLDEEMATHSGFERRTTRNFVLWKITSACRCRDHLSENPRTRATALDLRSSHRYRGGGRKLDPGC